jgi:hypothetical protein
MKIYDCEQGSAEWLRLRIGIPTASQFHKIITPAKAELSKQARWYAYYLIAERVLNVSLESVSQIDHMIRGREREPRAAELYEFAQQVVTRKVGLIKTDDGRMAASPDRLIEGKNAAVEIKCPGAVRHVAWMLEGMGPDYRPQVQGQILIAELEFVDRYSYHPQIPPVLVRTARDDDYIKKLQGALDGFLDMFDELLDRAHACGVFYEHKELLTPTEAMAEDLGGFEDRENESDPFGLLPLADQLRDRLGK